MFVSIYSDGGENRSEFGMRINSILFTILATSKLNDESFYDILCGASGDGRPAAEIMHNPASLGWRMQSVLAAHPRCMPASVFHGRPTHGLDHHGRGSCARPVTSA